MNCKHHTSLRLHYSQQISDVQITIELRRLIFGQDSRLRPISEFLDSTPIGSWRIQGPGNISPHRCKRPSSVIWLRVGREANCSERTKQSPPNREAAIGAFDPIAAG